MAELKNLGEAGRKALVDAWSCYIPKYGDEPFQTVTGGALTNGQHNGGGHGGMSHSGSSLSSGHQLVDEEEDDR